MHMAFRPLHDRARIISASDYRNVPHICKWPQAIIYRPSFCQGLRGDA